MTVTPLDVYRLYWLESNTADHMMIEYNIDVGLEVREVGVAGSITFEAKDYDVPEKYALDKDGPYHIRCYQLMTEPTEGGAVGLALREVAISVFRQYPNSVLVRGGVGTLYELRGWDGYGIEERKQELDPSNMILVPAQPVIESSGPGVNPADEDGESVQVEFEFFASDRSITWYHLADNLNARLEAEGISVDYSVRTYGEQWNRSRVAELLGGDPWADDIYSIVVKIELDASTWKAKRSLICSAMSSVLAYRDRPIYTMGATPTIMVNGAPQHQPQQMLLMQQY